jgi:hypothetical protein
MSQPSRSLVRELAPIAERQHGLFAREQVRELGVPDHIIDRRIASGDWVAVDHGVYRFAVTPTSWHQRVLAACLAGPAAASHRTAAALLGVTGFAGVAVEVTARRHRRRKAADVIWHESFHLDPVDVQDRAGIPTTTPARTFVDLATVLDDVGLVAVCDDLLRRRLTSFGELAQTIDRLGARRPGSGRARRALDRRRPAGGGVPESVLESEFEGVLHRFGLATPVRQLEVMDGGKVVARLDFAYPELLIDLEVDGAQWHASDDASARDRRRDAHLTRLGWLVRRFTAWDIRFRPEWVAAEVRHEVQLRSAVP